MNAALLMVLFAALMIAALWVGIVIRNRLPEHHPRPRRGLGA